MKNSIWQALGVKIDKEELYFTDGDVDMTTEEWEDAGRPVTWFEMYNKKGIIIYEDRAYGQVKLVTPDGENQGRDTAQVGDIVIFGPYYEGITRTNAPYKLMD